MRFFPLSSVLVVLVSSSATWALDLNDVAKGLAIINSLEQQQRQQQVQQPQTATQPPAPAVERPAASRETVRGVQ